MDNLNVYSLINTPISTQIVRKGMSIIEVMVAMVIFSVALLSFFGSTATLQNLRVSAQETTQMTYVARQLIDRIQGAEWKMLATATAPWSIPRVEDVVIGNFPPMNNADLIAQGLLVEDASLLTQLNVYVEYYRMVQSVDATGAPLVPPQPGIMDVTPMLKQQDFKSVFSSSANRSAARIMPGALLGLDDTTIIAQNMPILIRVLVTSDGGRKRTELFLGRSLYQ